SIATLLRAGEPEALAQRIEERRAMIEVQRVRFTVDRQAHRALDRFIAGGDESGRRLRAAHDRGAAQHRCRLEHFTPRPFDLHRCSSGRTDVRGTVLRLLLEAPRTDKAATLQTLL